MLLLDPLSFLPLSSSFLPLTTFFSPCRINAALFEQSYILISGEKRAGKIGRGGDVKARERDKDEEGLLQICLLEGEGEKGGKS